MSLTLLSCLLVLFFLFCYSVFFFNDTATTEIYTLSLHDALPIWLFRADPIAGCCRYVADLGARRVPQPILFARDRKSTRLNSSHTVISYAVFCLKKKKKNKQKFA